MYQTLIFWQDVAHWKDVRRVREAGKIRLHRVWASSILPLNISELQSNDILSPLSFHLGEIVSFWRCFHCLWPEDREKGSALIAIEGLFLPPAFIHAQIILKGISRNGRKKPSRYGCDWGDLVPEASWSKMGCNDALVNYELSLLGVVDKIKQTGS